MFVVDLKKSTYDDTDDKIIIKSMSKIMFFPLIYFLDQLIVIRFSTFISSAKPDF